VAGRRAMNLLDAVLLLPLAGFFLLLAAPKKTERMFALIISLIVFVVSLGLIAPYWFQSTPGYTFVTNIPWIESPAIRYHIALDGLSLWLVLLTTLLTPISVLISWKSIEHRAKEFFAFLILLEFGLIGVFVSMDLFLFFVFWEIRF
jgi:NADH-quinone oxidoreductase subunit M